jgi:hypothetical protein
MRASIVFSRLLYLFWAFSRESGNPPQEFLLHSSIAKQRVKAPTTQQRPPDDYALVSLFSFLRVSISRRRFLLDYRGNLWTSEGKSPPKVFRALSLLVSKLVRDLRDLVFVYIFALQLGPGREIKSQPDA